MAIRFLTTFSLFLLLGMSLAGNNSVEEIRTTTNDIEAKEFAQFLSMLSEIRMNIQQLDSSMKNIESRLNGLEAERQSAVNTNQLKTELNQLQEDFTVFQNERVSNSDISAAQSETNGLKSTVTQLSENVGLLIQESRSQFPEIRADVNSLRGKLQELSRQAVTDIKLGPVEYSQLWRGVGYFDQAPYVITRVSNFNADSYPDNVGRRKLQKLVNGSWRDIPSG